MHDSLTEGGILLLFPFQFERPGKVISSVENTGVQRHFTSWKRLLLFWVAAFLTWTQFTFGFYIFRFFVWQFHVRMKNRALGNLCNFSFLVFLFGLVCTQHFLMTLSSASHHLPSSLATDVATRPSPDSSHFNSCSLNCTTTTNTSYHTIWRCNCKSFNKNVGPSVRPSVRSAVYPPVDCQGGPLNGNPNGKKLGRCLKW